MPGNATILATFVLVAWGPASLAAYAFLRPQTAFLLSMMGGTMLLPEKLVLFSVPGVLAFDKTPYLALIQILGIALFHRRVLRRYQFAVLDGLLLAHVLFGIVTALINMEPIADGVMRAEGHSVMDAIRSIWLGIFWIGVPLIVARLLFRTEHDLKTLMAAFAVLATIYLLPFLWEVRMSPNLHRDLYGFHQHDFHQTRRGEGYRPMLWMAHGLAVALLNFNSFVAALTLWKAGERISRFSAVWFALISGFMLAIGRSMGALAFGVLGGILVFFFRPKMQAFAGFCIGIVVITYPVLRAMDAVPHEEIVSWIDDNVSHERALSLGFRFTMEGDIAERASLRPFFGWGGYCRWCVRDPRSGETASVPDGEWVIRYGERGLLGFFTSFGLLFAPLVASYRRISQVPDATARRLLGGLTVMVALDFLDLVPNSMFAPAMTYTLCGALYSLSHSLADPSSVVDDQPFARFAGLVGRLRAGLDPRGA